MSMGYASAQGYTGSPSNPTAPKFDWLGPVSKGLAIAGGVMDVMSWSSRKSEAADSARALRRQAVQVREQSFLDAIDIGHMGHEIMGTQTAVFGKSGAAMEGTPLAVLADTANQVDDNIARTIEQGRIAHAAYMRQARKMKRAEKGSKLGAIGSMFGAAGTLVGGPFGLIGAGVGIAAQTQK